MIKYLLIGGAALGGLALLTKDKVTGIAAVAKELKVSVTKLKNIKLAGLQALNLTIDLQVFNPTPQNLTISTGKVLTLSKIRFFDRTGKFLGESYPQVSGIEIPAQSGLTVSNIPVVINLQNAGAVLNTLVDTALSQSQLQYELTFEGLGQTFTINA